MRTFLIVSLILVASLVIGIAPAAADSTLNYPDTSRSQAINLGGGQHAFVFFDIPGDNDIFVHPINAFANPLLLVVNDTFTGYALWLDFEGFNGNRLQYGVYTCGGPLPCVFGFRQGTILL